CGVGDGVGMCQIDEDGRIGIGPLVPIDPSNGKPAELCWLAISPDDRSLFATNFGYSNISSFQIDGGELTVAKDPACPKVKGDGTARGLCGDITSGPSDNWITPDGEFLYQIYGNACQLLGSAVGPRCSLDHVKGVKIP